MPVVDFGFNYVLTHVFEHRYDLGDFNQKGSVATKWGTKDELMKLCENAESHGVGIYRVCELKAERANDPAFRIILRRFR